MTQANSVTIPALPAPLRWQNTPTDWKFGDGMLSINAGRKTDWFLDPGGVVNVMNAPALLMKATQPCMLKARVSAEHAAMFDASVLTVYQGENAWAKLCFELSPQGQVMIVSVVTRGTSDDCNSIPIAEKSVYLRLSKLDSAYAFHYSLDGSVWNMVRYFSLGGQKEAEIGFLSQSPVGEGCTAHFSEIAYLPQKLADIRSGE